MKLNNIFSDLTTQIFKVTNDDSDNQLFWTIMPTNLKLIPEDEGHFFIKAIQTLPNSRIDCFLNISTPERIADFVVKLDSTGQTILEDFNNQENSIIPTVPSDCYGDYELYYSKDYEFLL